MDTTPPDFQPVTAGNLSLNNCDQELIHLANAIQPHGALLVLAEPYLSILQFSENATHFLGLSTAISQGQTIDSVLGKENTDLLRHQLTNSNLSGALVYLMNISLTTKRDKQFHLFANRVDGVLLLEFEYISDSVSSSVSAEKLSGLQAGIQCLYKTESLKALLNTAVTWLKINTGFERVLAYQFAQDGSGEVIAEAKEDHLESYLGLHYPASDVPAPARRLFSYSPLRHLPDVNYIPVPLTPSSPPWPGARPVDLSCSFLRSVSTMYTEYLRNMGVNATLVMPLLTHGKLWGLISCMHHSTPKYLSYEQRVPVEVVGQVISLLISDREDQDYQIYRNYLADTLNRLIRYMGHSENLYDALVANEIDLLSAIDAQGAALITDNQLTLLGDTPSREQVLYLSQWLDKQESMVWSSHTLPQEFPEAINYNGLVGGLLTIRVSRTSQDRIIWFRPEILREVHWAGDPHKPVEIIDNDQQIRLRPRTSFALWKETVRHQSRPWLSCELEHATQLRQAILDILVERAKLIARVNEELKRKNEQLRKLFLAVEQTPESIIIIDTRGSIEYINNGFIQTTGYKREEIIGQHLETFYLAYNPPELCNKIWPILNQGEPWQGELIGKNKDEKFYTLFVTISPVRQNDNNVTHYVAVGEDISQKKILSEELTSYRHHLEDLVTARTTQLDRQSQFLQALIDNLPHMAWLKDKEGRVIAANRALAELFGLTTAELVGKTDFDVAHPEIAQRFHEDDQLVIATGQQKIIEETITGYPHSLYETYKAPVFDDDGTVMGIVGFSRNIKPQREIEAELARRATEAEVATRAKSVFLANMSHEIRTPLTAILGFAETMLQMEQTPEERIEAIHTILRNGKHLRNLISDILDLSKIEAERIDIEHTQFSLPNLLADIHQLAKNQAQDKGLIFTSHYFPELPAIITSDPTRVKQILLNLIGNAIKFTSAPGAIRLIVSLDLDREQLMLAIHDNGVGISTTDLPRLFEPFVQADASTTRKFGGTGLGLSISRRLARQLGGNVVVMSDLHYGSLFIVTLATGCLQGISLINLENDPGIVVPQESAISLIPQLTGTVLVAEDNGDNQRLISWLIQRTGANTVITTNGQEALERAQTEEFNLVLMDMQMPIMNGIDATTLLRLTGFDQPIVALTANTTEADVAQAKEAGCNDFFSKPIEQAAFFAMLARYLSPASRSSPPPAKLLANKEDEDPAFLAMTNDFLHNLPDRLQELALAGQQQNWSSVRFLCHQLKGVAATFGMPELTDLAGKTELAILSSHYSEAEQLLAELIQLCHFNH